MRSFPFACFSWYYFLPGSHQSAICALPSRDTWSKKGRYTPNKGFQKALYVIRFYMLCTFQSLLLVHESRHSYQIPAIIRHLQISES